MTTQLGKLAYWLVLAMMGVAMWNAIGRYLGNLVGQNLSSNALIEIQWCRFDLIFSLGAAYTLQKGGHVRGDGFYNRWSCRHKALADVLSAWSSA